MSNLTIKSGEKEITLKKSGDLVGLKTVLARDAEKPDFVDSEVYQNLGGFSVVTLVQERGKTLDDKLDEVRQSESVEVGTHIYFAEGSQKPIIATGDIYITFQQGVGEKEQKIVLEEFYLQLVERRSIDTILARVTEKSPNPLKVAAALQKISLVRSAEPDIDTVMDAYDFTTPPDDLLGHEWHLKNEGLVPDVNFKLKKGADAKVIDAWKRLGNAGSSEIVVAVIDNGFDLTHPDLKDKIHNPFDLWNQSAQISMGDPSFTHGTPCASVAIGTSNGKGMVGAAPNARFMPVSGTSFSNRATEQMFDYCIKNGADIISCSWGTTDRQFSLGTIKESAITKAARQGRNGKGCVIVYAVGNEDFDYVNFYAAHPNVIAVAASTSQDAHASYSNRGKEVTICAPSNGDWPILAARAYWDQGISSEVGEFKFWRDGRSRGNQYKHFGGTSSATPLVAGICALVLSANPDLTASEVKDILKLTADKIGHPTEYDAGGHSNKYGFGRINADKAVAEALRRKEGIKPSVEVEGTVSTGKGLFKFSVERQPPVGWGIQVGVYADYGNVLIAADKLQRQFGQPIIVNINELKGQTVYKVVVGVFDNADQAKQLNTRMKQAGINGFPRKLEELV